MVFIIYMDILLQLHMMIRMDKQEGKKSEIYVITFLTSQVDHQK